MAARVSLWLVAGFILAASGLAACPAVYADDGGHGRGSQAGEDDDDHDLARDLVEHGEIRPLQEIIRALSGKLKGSIVAIRLVRESDRWVYSFTVVTADGTRMKLDVNAADMTIIDEERQ